MNACLMYNNKDIVNMVDKTVFDDKTKSIFMDFLIEIGGSPIDGLYELLINTPGIYINELESNTKPYFLYEMSLNMFSNVPELSCFYWESENLDVIPDELLSYINVISSDVYREGMVADLIRHVIYELIWAVTSPVRKNIEHDSSVSLKFMYVPREFLNFSPPLSGSFF